MLAAMKRRAGKRLTVKDLAVAMKLDPKVWDNCAAVIWAAGVVASPAAWCAIGPDGLHATGVNHRGSTSRFCWSGLL